MAELSAIISSEMDAMNEVCQEYQEVIVFSNLRKPADVTEFMVQRWKDELANRRQYLSYLQSLFEDVSKCGRKVSFLRESYLSELDDLSAMVGSRNSVPKEHVYPKFDKIAKLWSNLGDELEVITCRERTLDDLVNFKASYNATLSKESQILAVARDAPTLSTEEEEEAAKAAVLVTGAPPHAESKDVEPSAEEKVRGVQGAKRRSAANIRDTANWHEQLLLFDERSSSLSLSRPLFPPLFARRRRPWTTCPREVSPATSCPHPSGPSACPSTPPPSSCSFPSSIRASAAGQYSPE